MGKKLKVTIEGDDFEKPFVLEGHGDAVRISKAVYALVPDAHEPLDLPSLLQKAKEWGLCELGFWSIDDASQVLKFEPYPDISISPAGLEAVKKFLEGDVMAFEGVEVGDKVRKAFKRYPCNSLLCHEADLSRQLGAGAVTALYAHEPMKVAIDDYGKLDVRLSEMPPAYKCLRKMAKGRLLTSDDDPEAFCA